MGSRAQPRHASPDHLRISWVRRNR